MAGVNPNHSAAVHELDLASATLREVNAVLHGSDEELAGKHFSILHPAGRHSIAAGMNAALPVDIQGHVGYYAAGMNQHADITIHGNAGCGVAENMMSGSVSLLGNASTCAGASAHGGLLFIRGDASSRCGISLKGADIVVGGSVGHMSGFMAQAGRIVVCGDAGTGLGDSLYEAVIYVRGRCDDLGADAQQEPMTDDDYQQLTELLKRTGLQHNPQDFKRIASARNLYHWNADTSQEY